MAVYRYEDLEVWKAARSLCSEIYGLRRAMSEGVSNALIETTNSIGRMLRALEASLRATPTR
jgi:hypothetical protein